MLHDMSVSALPDSRAAQELVARHARRTPLLSSRLLSEETGFDVRLKAELFQRTGSYKLRGPLVKLERLSEDERARGVVCSSAGNHAQGVALAAALLGVRAVVVMAENATPSKVEATRGYGADVVLHGTIWDEADAKARELVESDGLTYVHPFDDVDLISGQGTVGLEILEDWPEVELVVVPIGGGGLISGIATAVKRERDPLRVVPGRGADHATGPLFLGQPLELHERPPDLVRPGPLEQLGLEPHVEAGLLGQQPRGKKRRPPRVPRDELQRRPRVREGRDAHRRRIARQAHPSSRRTDARSPNAICVTRFSGPTSTRSSQCGARARRRK